MSDIMSKKVDKLFASDHAINKEEIMYILDRGKWDDGTSLTKKEAEELKVVIMVLTTLHIPKDNSKGIEQALKELGFEASLTQKQIQIFKLVEQAFRYNRENMEKLIHLLRQEEINPESALILLAYGNYEDVKNIINLLRAEGLDIKEHLAFLQFRNVGLVKEIVSSYEWKSVDSETRKQAQEQLSELFSFNAPYGQRQPQDVEKPKTV